MKKLILTCFISTAFVSCKKEYTCTLAGTQNGVFYSSSYKLKEKSKADAQQKCKPKNTWTTATLK